MRHMFRWCCLAVVSAAVGCASEEPLSQSEESTLTTPAGSVWVAAADGSLTQFPDNGASTAPGAQAQPNSIPLEAHAALLNSKGVTAIALKKKLLPIPLPFSLPIDEAHALRGGNGSLIPGANVTPPNINPAPLPSGILNAFLIPSGDLGKARAAGFFTPNTAAYVSEEECGSADAVVTLGQSNSANSGGNGLTTPTRPDSSGALMFFNGHCYPARDPLLGASIWLGGASVWLQFAKTYIARNPGKKIIIVPFGIGSSGSWEWAVGGQFHRRMVSVLDQAKAARLNVKWVFWHQGETDGENASTLPFGQTYNYYLQNFNSMKAVINSRFPGVPISVAMGTYVRSSPYFVSREVQKVFLDLAINNYPNVRLGPASDFLGFPYRANVLAGVTYDDVHFNDAGLSLMGTWWHDTTYRQTDYQTHLRISMIQTYLSRQPQAGELATLVARGSLQAAADFVRASDEYFLRELYRRYARRLPDADGYFYWQDRLQGTNRATVEAEFSTAVRATQASPDPSRFAFLQMPNGWWGAGFSYLEPRFNPGPFLFDHNTGMWMVNGTPPRFPLPLSAPRP